VVQVKLRRRNGTVSKENKLLKASDTVSHINLEVTVCSVIAGILLTVKILDTVAQTCDSFFIDHLIPSVDERVQ
jgi:hypothetical protein